MEVRRVLRYREIITGDTESANILRELQKHNLEFSIKLQSMGGVLNRCIVLSVTDNDVSLFSNAPRKVTLQVSIKEIEEIEVESNCDFIAEENDEGGRWSRLM